MKLTALSPPITPRSYATPLRAVRGIQARFSGIESEPEEFGWHRDSTRKRPVQPSEPSPHKPASKEPWLYRLIPWVPVSIKPIIPQPGMEIGNLPTNLETRSAMWRHGLDIQELIQLKTALQPLGFESSGSVDAIGMYDFIQAGLGIRRPLFLPKSLRPHRKTVQKLTGMIQELLRSPTRFYVRDNDNSKARINVVTLDREHSSILVGNEASIEVDQQARAIRSRHRKGDEWKSAGDLEHLPEPINLDIAGAAFAKPRVSILIQRTEDGNLILVNQSPTNEPLVTLSDGVPIKLATNSVPLASGKHTHVPVQGLTHSLVLRHPNDLWRTDTLIPPISALIEPRPSKYNPLYISVQPQRGFGNDGQDNGEAEWVVTVTPNKPGKRQTKLQGEK